MAFKEMSTIEGKLSPSNRREDQVFNSPYYKAMAEKKINHQILPDLPVGPYSGQGQITECKHSTRRRYFKSTTLDAVKSQLSFDK